jgi:prephenate dehydratase
MMCAVLGPRGTFSEEAASIYWGSNTGITTAPTIPDLFRMLISGETDDLLVPIDNSLVGSIDACISCLQEYQVTICGEIRIPIHQHLMACENYSLDDLELIISQPAALLQCTDFLDSQLPGIRTEICSSTTRALQIISRESRKAAGIANSRAAAIYGLQVLQEDIQNPDNTTRFIHVCRQKEAPGNGEKASIIITLPHTPGSLYKALEILAIKGFNLNKIESRPDRNNKNNFNFYMEAETGGNCVKLQEALEELGQYCTNVKYLGAYNEYKGARLC